MVATWSGVTPFCGPKIAVAPFFNLSSDSSVDGRQFAEAYFNELQLIPGFEVAPIGVVLRPGPAVAVGVGGSAS